MIKIGQNFNLWQNAEKVARDNIHKMRNLLNLLSTNEVIFTNVNE